MRFSTFGRTITGALFVSAALIAIAGYARSSAAPPKPAQAIFIDMRAAKTVRDTAGAALMSKAQLLRQVRVIVGLDIALRPADALTEPEFAEQTVRLRARQNAVAARAGIPANAVTVFDYIPFVSLWVNAAHLKRLLNDRSIVNIQEDAPGHAGLNLSAPFIKADELWQDKIKGSGFAIAVLDTGIDKTHPMLADKVVSEACYSTNNAAQGVTSLCPNGVTHSAASGSGANCPANIDSCWHGTHIAGIAAGRTVRESAATKLTGVAPNAKLISIKVFSAQGGKAVTFDSDWIRGLERVYALRKKFKIAAANLSFGSGKFTGPCDAQNAAATKAIRLLRKVNIALIAASMNDGYDGATAEPACISEAIAVGATLHTANTIAGYSNHAPWVRMLAPGSGIVSAKPGGKYRAGDGTSMAAPHVAGAFALLRDVAASATVDDISSALECSGPLVQRASISKPRIDLAAAKSYLLSPPTTTFDFSFASSASGWISVLGNWQPTFGFYGPRENTAGYKLALLPNCNESADITAVRMQRQGPDPQTTQGVLFKIQITSDNKLSGYFGGYDRQGNARIERLDGFDVTTNTGNRVTLCSGTPTLAGDGYNNVQLSTRGRNHTLSVNGQVVCTAHDGAYGTGSTGVLGYFATSSATNLLAVDEFVLQPAETTPVHSPADELIVAAEPPA